MKVTMKNINIEIGKEALFNEKTFLKNSGENNSLILKSKSKFGTLGTPKVDFIGNNNTIIFEEFAVFKRGHLRIVGDNQTISVGRKTTINSAYLLVDEGCSITIGEDCMFSNGIELRTTDAHSILDKETGERINKAKSIVIGNHVWVGKEVMISKGVNIPSNVIVGARALVTKSFTNEYVAIAGVPAVEVKSGVTWDRRKL